MKNWFESRNLKVLTYQTDTIQKVKDSLINQEITVLAACPSAGKTIMTIHCIEDYLNNNPNHKVIVLAHGTTILRTQFHDVLKETHPGFTYKLVESFDEYDEDKDVNVCLPQTLKGKKLNMIDLLVVDEAHQFYFGEKMVKDIIKKTKPNRQLLLTGTPSIFIREKLPIIPVTLNTIFNEGMVSDVYVEIATSSYSFGIYDYNQQDELKSEVHFKSSETKKTLDDLIEKIVDRLKSIRGNEYVNMMPEWLPTLKRLQKTMIACRSQAQATQVKNYFDKISVKSALSISDTDIESEEIENFKNDIDCLVLIVVGRGILGFNYPELVNVVDMTTSQNVDRIYQLFCRVIRKHPRGERKLFFKIAPNTLSDYYKYVMTGVLALSDEYYFTHYNGKNFNDMEIPVRPHIKGSGLGGGSISTSLKKHPKRTSPIDFSGLPVFELFKDIYHKKNSLLDTYAYTTIRDVRAEFLKRVPAGYWTKDKCLYISKKYQRPIDWYENDSGSYDAARSHGWYDECTKHMMIVHWTRDKCIESSKKYTTKKDWFKNEPSAHNAARKNGWYKDCVFHMDTLVISWTKKKCLEDASKYNNIRDWKKNSDGGYQAASYHKWLKDCTKHMIRLNQPPGYWTKDKCIENAQKYKTINDWSKNNPYVVIISRQNNWYEECIDHMIEVRKPSGYWVKRKCIESALKYQKPSIWKKNEPSPYDAARKNGWLDECIEHMKKNKK